MEPKQERRGADTLGRGGVTAGLILEKHSAFGGNPLHKISQKGGEKREEEQWPSERQHGETIRRGKTFPSRVEGTGRPSSAGRGPNPA